VPVAPGVDDVPDDDEVLVVVVGGVAVEDDVDTVGAGVLVTVDRPLTTKPPSVEGDKVEGAEVEEVEVEEVVDAVGVGVIVGERVVVGV